MPHLSSLLNRFNEPETLKMAKLGRELRANGVDVIDLSLGEPDFDTPNHVKQAAIRAIEENWSHYTPVPGFLDLREAVCEKLKRDNKLEYKPTQIVVSTGAKQSLANLILSLVDENQEVIIPTPYWVTYSELVKIARGKVVEIRTSPCNPSGAVYNEEELEALVKVFEKYPDITIISDEIYEYINFVGNHVSIASFPSVVDRVAIVNGLSKGFAMTGWRVGYIAASETIAKACEKIQGQFTSGTNSIAQRAAIAALREDLRPTQEMVKEFAARRELVLQLVSKIPGIQCPSPEGAFYIFPDMRAYFGRWDGEQQIKNAADLSMFLLNKAHVSSVMGDAFGEPNCIRFSFANSREKIKEGWARIQQALGSLRDA
jgi:aspartate aminotransferase